MEKFQSNSDELVKQIKILQKRRLGKYSFIWNHPIKLPKEILALNQVQFWDRKNDYWITLDKINILPHFKDFPAENISILPDEKNYYLIVGSFAVTIKKSIRNLAVTIKIII